MGAFRLWPFLSIIASGLVPDAIVILLCEAVEAGSHNDGSVLVSMMEVDYVDQKITRIYMEWAYMFYASLPLSASDAHRRSLCTTQWTRDAPELSAYVPISLSGIGSVVCACLSRTASDTARRLLGTM